MKKKTTVSLDEQTIDRIKKLAISYNLSAGDIVKWSTQLMEMMHDSNLRGGKMLIEDKEGNLSQITAPTKL